MVKRINIFPFRSPFNRKKKKYSDYVIDLGKLKDKGLIQESIESGNVTDSAVKTETSESSEPDSALGFLGSLAGAGSDSNDSDNEVTTTRRNIDRDSEEKLDMISDRTYKLLERLDLLEHKINRVEKRMGIGENY